MVRLPFVLGRKRREGTMYRTTEDWRAARAALVDELTRLRHQFDCGAPLGRHEALHLVRSTALVPAHGFHRPGRRPTMSGLCN
jgi:hypothetical protein